VQVSLYFNVSEMDIDENITYAVDKFRSDLSFVIKNALMKHNLLLWTISYCFYFPFNFVASEFSFSALSYSGVIPFWEDQ
jgi:hypothetical protein